MGSTAAAAREIALKTLLDAIVADDLEGWLSAPPVPGDEAWTDSLRIWGTLLAREWAQASLLAATVDGVPRNDPAAWLLRMAVLAWAASGDPSPGPARSLTGYDEVSPDLSSTLERVAAYVLVEAGLAHARLDLAAGLVDRCGSGLWAEVILDGDSHGFHLMMVACRARLLAFRGHITEAAQVMAEVGEHHGKPGSLGALRYATQALVLGNDADPRAVRRLCRAVDELVPSPRDVLGAGAHMLGAFGLIAIGDVADAARHVLLAGGNEDLDRLNVIDRALGLEMLVALAVAGDDRDAARAWQDRAAPLLTSSIADSTVARINSRVALLEGDPPQALVWAERAVDLAKAADRMVEYAEGEIVLSRARIARSDPGDRAAAVRRLREVVGEAEARGHRAARASVRRELRGLGRRLPPLAGSGLAGLSAREVEVAELMRSGAGNRQIARELFVSEHTVRAHVSRVLAAFGVATRSGLPAALEAHSAGGCNPTRAVLSVRQREVAGLISRGLSNAAIATELGLSVRTVERHVSDILVRWDLTNRTSIARAMAESPR